MAGFLAPQLAGGGAAAFEQPVQAVSGVGAIAGLVSGFARAAQSTAAAKPTQSEKFGAALKAYQAEKGFAFDQDDPVSFKANITEFVLKHPQFQTEATAFGNTMGLDLISPEARKFSFEQELVSSEAFQGQLALLEIKNPDWSDEELHAAALNKTTTSLATAAAIANSQTAKDNNWLEIESAYEGRASEVAGAFTLMLESVQKDKVISAEEAGQVREFFNRELGNLRQPVGVSDEQWNSFQEKRITPLSKIFEGVVKLEGGINDDMTRALGDIIAKAVSQDKLPTALLIKFQQGSDGSYTSLKNILEDFDFKDGDPFLDNYKSAMKMSYTELLDWVTEFEFKGADDYLEKVDMTEFKALKGDKRQDALEKHADSVRRGDAPPEQAVLDIINIVEMTHTFDKDLLSPSGFDEVYSKGFFTSMKNVSDVNPDIGRRLAERTREGLASQLSTVVTAQLAIAGAANFNISSKGALTVIPEKMSAAARQVVEERFGGDWEAAFRATSGGFWARSRDDWAQGVLASVASGPMLPQQTDPTYLEFKKASGVFEELRLLSKYITTINSKMDILKETMPEVFEVEGIAQRAGEVSSGVAALQVHIDATEGRGDYDKLFNNSEAEGKQFSQVRVSEMTIGELREFTKPRGQYGIYVKGTNPEGVTATPMGRYQFVGTTMLEVAKQMGLPDSTVFTPEVQDAMFAHRVRWRLDKADTMEGKMRQLRLEWAGFAHVSDAELVRSIEVFQTGKPITETTLAAPADPVLAPADPVLTSDNVSKAELDELVKQLRLEWAESNGRPNIEDGFDPNLRASEILNQQSVKGRPSQLNEDTPVKGTLESPYKIQWNVSEASIMGVYGAIRVGDHYVDPNGNVRIKDGDNDLSNDVTVNGGSS
jgi:hypothetical protein